MGVKPKKINLNDWDKVETEEELEGYQSMVIVPMKLEDGTQLPSLFFRKKQNKHPLITDTEIEGLTWEEECRISITGTSAEYCKRVDWWFENARNDPDFRNSINTTFNRQGFDVVESWNKAIVWLKSTTQTRRKSYIKKFIWEWLRKGFSWQVDRIKKQRGGNNA